MQIGGISLAAGDILVLDKDDYLLGRRRLRLIVHAVRVHDDDWVILDGLAQPDAVGGWRARTVQARIACLKRALTGF